MSTEKKLLLLSTTDLQNEVICRSGDLILVKEDNRKLDGTVRAIVGGHEGVFNAATFQEFPDWVLNTTTTKPTAAMLQIRKDLEQKMVSLEMQIRNEQSERDAKAVEVKRQFRLKHASSLGRSPSQKKDDSINPSSNDSVGSRSVSSSGRSPNLSRTNSCQINDATIVRNNSTQSAKLSTSPNSPSSPSGLGGSGLKRSVSGGNNYSLNRSQSTRRANNVAPPVVKPFSPTSGARKTSSPKPDRPDRPPSVNPVNPSPPTAPRKPKKSA